MKLMRGGKDNEIRKTLFPGVFVIYEGGGGRFGCGSGGSE